MKTNLNIVFSEGEKRCFHELYADAKSVKGECPILDHVLEKIWVVAMFFASDFPIILVPRRAGFSIFETYIEFINEKQQVLFGLCV